MKLQHLLRRGGAYLGLAFGSLWTGLARAAVQPESGLSFPRDVSLDGHRIDSLIIITGWFVTLLFVIMCIWLFWACFAHGRDNEAEYDHGESKHSVIVALSLSLVIFVIVDGNLFINSVIDINEAFWNYGRALESPEHVKIEVNAHQWAWDARYAGPDGAFNTADDIVTLNDIRVPVETPVILQLASTDVIHSFSLPNMRIKQDAVPGTVTPMWFQAQQTGEFDIACQQHCGTYHYKMKGKLTVLSKSDYAAWTKQSSRIAELAFDEDDADAHWGWDWLDLGR